MMEESERSSKSGARPPRAPSDAYNDANGNGESADASAIPSDRILARLEVLGLLDDLDVAQEVIDVFVHDAGQTLEALDRAVQTWDAPACERYGHRLKGSSLNLGIEEMGALARTLEEKGRSGDLTGAEELYARLCLEYDLLCSLAPRILHRAA